MEPRKITGVTLATADGSPSIDVDTAILALHEELRLSGRMRAANALGAVINAATQISRPWRVVEHGGVDLQVLWVDQENGIIGVVLGDKEGSDDASSD